MDQMISRTLNEVSASKQPTANSKRLARHFSQVQALAGPLFAAMSTGCVCTCGVEHRVLMRLDNRLLDHPTRAVQRTCIFDLVWDLSGNLQDMKIKVTELGEDEQAGKKQ